MKLSDWIASYGGREAVASRLGISRVAICHWLTGKTSPRIETCQKIIDLSGGRVTLSEILAETKKVKTRRKHSP